LDIWSWINQVEADLRGAGQERLAELLDKLPEYTCDNRHAQVDAIYPEALALARSSGQPWLEVYVRHWNLQSRILHRYEVADWMEEAVSLLEFAHRPETRECPQSVCVTQDLVSCYANTDGPGYAAERLEATEETLARIDAKWPCWTCISSEHANALLDDGRAADALAFIDAALRSMTAANARHEPVPLAGSRIDALIALDRRDEAMAVVEEAERFPTDRSHAQFRALDRALLLCLSGDFEAARRALIPYETAVQTQGQYERWSDVVTRLALAGALPNDWHTDTRLRRMQDALVRHGIVRVAIGIADRRARLALARERPWTARACCDQIAELLPRLRRPLGADTELAALHDKVEARPVDAPELSSAQGALELCGDDPEADAELLTIALERWPDEQWLVIRLAEALRAMNRWSDAEAVLRAFCARHPEATEPFLLLGNTLLAMDRHDAVLTLAAGALAAGSPTAKATGYWLRAQASRAVDDLQSAREALTALLEIQPGAVNATTTLAEIEREAGRYQAALDHLDPLVDAQPEAGPYDWDLMVVATLLERWPLVRKSAARLGFELAGEGPIDQNWGLCRLSFQLEGERAVLFAQRTGPVTARVLQMRGPDELQFFRDHVVFEAAPLNEPPANDEEAETHSWIYTAIAAIERGAYRVHVVDGVFPGDEVWDGFAEALDAAGCAVQIASSDAYLLADPETGDERRGVYAYLAAPPAVDDAALDALLTEHSAAFPALLWPGVLEALGDEARSEAQAEIARAWGM